MDWKLEVVVIPVTDIDRAKSFYTAKLGFRLDADTTPTETMRVVHMTPPGSGCSVVIGPKVRAGAKSTTLYQHQNVLKTVMKALGLSSFPGAASNAAGMTDVF